MPYVGSGGDSFTDFGLSSTFRTRVFGVDINAVNARDLGSDPQSDELTSLRVEFGIFTD